MIGDDTYGNVRLILLLIFHTGNLTHPRAQRQHRVHIKNRIHILHRRRQTLQSHAGINILLHKLRIIALAVIVELGKHVVPDLHIAVAVTAYRTTGLAAAILLSTVIINLRTGAAGTGTMLPEIIFLAETEDPLRRNAHLFIPDFEGFLILFIDGRIEPVRIQSHHLRKKFPAPRDGLALKVIPEREISQHLEKGAVSCRLTYILQIPCTDTFLTGGNPPSGRNLLSRKIRLKRRHTGIDQQKAVVIVRYQRKALHLQMFLALEKFQEHSS